MTVAQLFK